MAYFLFHLTFSVSSIPRNIISVEAILVSLWRPKMSACHDTCVLDPKGDLRLEIGADANWPASVIVCSRTLSRVSPVFKAMLSKDYGFKESIDQPNGWVVSLPEDCSITLAQLRQIAHGDFSQLPNFDIAQELYDLLTIADKYNCIQIVTSFWDAWKSQRLLKHPDNHDYFISGNGGWEIPHHLGIHAIVGDTTIFNKFLDLAIKESWVSSDMEGLYARDLNEDMEQRFPLQLGHLLGK